MSTLAQARSVAIERQDYAPLLALIPYARFLGVHLERRGDEVVSVLPFRDALVGNAALPALHGGVTAAFMENAAILHLLLALDQARLPKSIDFALDYLLPGRPEECVAACQVSRAGVRVAQVQVRCWQRDPRQPIAIARAHFLLIPS